MIFVRFIIRTWTSYRGITVRLNCLNKRQVNFCKRIFFICQISYFSFGNRCHLKINPQNQSWLKKSLTRWPSWHELPKSTIFIALRFGLHNRMFSGFKSQWMMLKSLDTKNISAVHNCCANLRVKFKETPRKLVLRRRSYKLYDKSSNTRHKWFRCIKWPLSLTKQKISIIYSNF